MATRSARMLRWKKNILQFIVPDSLRLNEQQQIKKALRDSEDKYRSLFENARDAIILADTETGIIVDVNTAGCHLLGLPREKIVGLYQSAIHPPAMSEQYEQLFHDHVEKGTLITDDIVIQRADGALVPVDISANVIKMGEKSIIQGIFRDITERRQIEKILRESEEKFAVAFRSSPEMIAIANLKEGKYIDINDSYARITGYTREEMIGRPMNETNMWVDPEESQNMIRRINENGKVANQEYSFRMKSGEIRQWLCSAEIITIGGDPCVISVAADITERKQMEQALRESEEKFAMAFRCSPQMIIIIDRKSNKYLEINDRYANVLGYSHEELMSRKVDEIPMWVKPEELHKMVTLLQTQGKVRNEEFSFRTKSGEILQWLCSAEIVTIGGKQCSLAVATDITERKQAENKLKEALANLEHSTTQLKATNKELESFSYSVSHDLRSPLRSIDGFSQALLEDYAGKLDETGKDYLNRLRSASQKMGELIDGLLKLSRLTRSEMHLEKVDLSALAEEISTRLQETDPNRHGNFIIDSGLSAEGDPQMLRVLLENLLANAWKFTRKTPQARIEFGSTTNGAGNTFFIKDNGAGFDMAYKDKLFSAFQRLHDTADFPGTGIGLATVQRIINRHGGSIHAEGAVGKGATFYFTLS